MVNVFSLRTNAKWFNSTLNTRLTASACGAPSLLLFSCVIICLILFQEPFSFCHLHSSSSLSSHASRIMVSLLRQRFCGIFLTSRTRVHRVPDSDPEYQVRDFRSSMRTKIVFVRNAL